MPGGAFAAITTYVANAAIIGFGMGSYAAVVLGNLVAMAVLIGSTVALSAVTDALTPKPDKQSFVSELAGRTQTIKQPITVHRVIFGEVRVGGSVTFLQTTHDDGLWHLIVTFCGHSINSIQQYFYNDEEQTIDASGFPTGGTWNDGGSSIRTRIVAGLGTTAGDATFNTALQTNLPGIWTTNHRQSGRAKAYIQGVSENFRQGIPNVTFIVRGNNEIYDPRDLSTGYTNNAALCIRKYLTDTSFGLGEPTTRIDEASFIAAANICDETVTLSDATTEARYTINGVIETTKTPKVALGEMLGACAGTLTHQGGKWALYVGAYRTPTITFDENVLDGPISVQTRIGRRDNFNRVKGVFVNPADLYQPTDFPVVTNATYLAEDNNEAIWKDIALGFTTSAATAQRLAKIELERARQQITVSFPMNLNGMRVQIGDVVNITNARMGWTAKPFEVTDWSFANRGDGDSPRLGVDLGLRETASTVFDWANGEETTLDPAPNSNLPNPFVVGTVGTPSITEELFSTMTGAGVKTKAIVSWTASSNSFINRYRVEHKSSSASEWISHPFIKATTFEIWDIAPGVYDFRYYAITDLRTEKASTTRTQEIFGLSVPPADITGLSISALSSLAVLSWTPHPDLDVKEGGKIIFRHSNQMTGAAWGGSVSIGKAVPGTTNTVILPLKSGTYLCKAVDSSGIQSVTAATITTNAATLTNFANLSTLSAHTAFAGTHSNTVVDGSVLKLDGATAIDAWGTVDAVAQWDAEGGIKTSGTYTMQYGIDLGSVKKTRLGTDITTVTTNAIVLDLVDSRAANIDTWESFDGVTGAQTDAEVEVRETDDDPAGTPTWDVWKRLEVADYQARAFHFRLNLESNDPTFNIRVSQLTITADEVV